ncbi:MAG: hypothetical protein H6828_02585 [Planctomycetes bacterium]|nr:hypothetical protein [Planctomycetota bacterium]
MKNAILINVLVAAVAGAAGAFVLHTVSPATGGGHTGSNAAQGLTPLGEDEQGGLQEQLASLGRKNEELAMRLAALERRGGSAREAVASEGGEDLAQLQADIAELAAALKDPQSAQSTTLRTSVRLAMDQIREEESAERDREREDREITRIDERLTELQGQLGLDQVQMKSMREVLLVESTKRNELFNTMRDGGGGMDRGAIRTAMTDLRDQTRTSLSTILTPLQLEDYEKLNDDRFGGFGGFGGPGGGGRGGRGGNTGGGGRGGNGGNGGNAGGQGN